MIFRYYKIAIFKNNDYSHNITAKDHDTLLVDGKKVGENCNKMNEGCKPASQATLSTLIYITIYYIVK